MISTQSERPLWCQTTIGVGKAFLVVFSGWLSYHYRHCKALQAVIQVRTSPSNTPQPTDRQPGSMPPELSEPSDEYEEQELFVPADIDHHEIETPEATRREYFARHFSYERRASSDTETENHIHEREAGVHTPTPHSHDRPSYLGQSPSMLSPTPMRATNASLMNGDSAPHS